MPESKINKIFSAPDVKHGLSLFTESEIKAIEKLIIEQEGKLLIKCQIKDRYKVAKPEELVRQLEYKCSWYGSYLLKAPVNFPSTKMCSRCGYVNPTLLLSQRIFQCKECQMECDRDVNAAKNLERYAFTVSSTGSNACGEAVQQGSSMKQEVLLG